MISQALHFAGSARGDERLSLKVLESLARQRDQDARDRCYDVLKALPSECFVIIDESSIDRRTLRRRRGWAPVNKPARLYELFTVPGAGLRSLIAAVNSEGFVLPACKLLHDGVTDEALYEWAEECLIPILNPFDHDNPKKNSILVLDNAVIHHSPSFVFQDVLAVLVVIVFVIIIVVGLHVVLVGATSVGATIVGALPLARGRGARGGAPATTAPPTTAAPATTAASVTTTSATTRATAARRWRLRALRVLARARAFGPPGR